MSKTTSNNLRRVLDNRKQKKGNGRRGGKNETRHTAKDTPKGWNERQLSKFLTVGEAKDSPAIKLSPKPLPYALPLGTLGHKSSLVSYASDDHMLSIAPSRAGKGTTQIIPTLLSYSGSALVIDIKGENHAITGRHRASFKKGAKVFKFAPFENDSEQFNPLDFIRGETGNPNAHELAITDCNFLAELMIPSHGGQDSFWVTDARNLLAAVLLYVKTHPAYANKCNMGEVYDIFAAPEGFKERLDDLVVGDENGTKCEEVGLLLGIFGGYEEKVLSSVRSTITSELMCWFAKPVRRATAHSTFSFEQLKQSMLDADAPTTIYIVIPPAQVRASRNLLRTIVGIAINAMLRDNKKPKQPVLYLLDEFPALGFMPAVLDGLAYVAGYGVKLWTFAQSIGQLKAIYGEAWQIFPASAGMFSAFNVNDVDTADYLSRLLGKTEEYQQEYWVTDDREDVRLMEMPRGGNKDHFSDHDPLDNQRENDIEDLKSKGYVIDGYANSRARMKRNWTEPKRQHRFKVDEVGAPNQIRTIGNELSLVFLKGEKPALVRKLPYFQVEEFNGKYDKWE